MNRYWITQLTVLQNEDYDLSRWVRWWWKNPLHILDKSKKALVWTVALKVIAITSLFLTFISGYVAAVFVDWLSGLFILSFLLVFPVPVLLVSVAGYKSMRAVYLWWLIYRLELFLDNYPSLTRVGITGSYGKSSVKEMLRHILSYESYTVATPHSYNTPIGIWRVVRNEIFGRVKYFVCEMGAFGKGDIAVISRAVRINWGVITAVGPQHLERFGSVEKIAETKFELYQSIIGSRKVVVNWDSSPLRAYVLSRGIESNLIRVSMVEQSAEYLIEGLRITGGGTRFNLIYGNNSISVNTKLFGTVNAINLSLAIATSFEMGISEDVVIKSITTLSPLPHRLELKKIGRATIIDNAYSSNIIGFKSVIVDLKSVKGSKVLITPGLVELGVSEYKEHFDLGKAMPEIFDRVVLVGSSVRTRAIADGLKAVEYKGVVEAIDDNIVAYREKLSDLSEKYDWVLMENDLPDQYK